MIKREADVLTITFIFYQWYYYTTRLKAGLPLYWLHCTASFRMYMKKQIHLLSLFLFLCQDESVLATGSTLAEKQASD